MTGTQSGHLVKMANQIARNMAAWGDEEAVARMTGEHIGKFWTPAMRRQLLDYSREGADELSPVVLRVLAAMEESENSEGQST